MNALALFESPQNLDIIAHAIEYIDRHADEIERLLFIGNKTALNDTDKAPLGKELRSSAYQ